MWDPAARPYTNAASSNIASSKQGGASKKKVHHLHVSFNERLKWGTISVSKRQIHRAMLSNSEQDSAREEKIPSYPRFF